MPSVATTVDNLTQMILDTAGKTPQAIALIEDEQGMTYGQLAENIRHLAVKLQAMGLQSGHKVALLLHNQKEYVVSFFALLGLGVTVIPLNVRLTAGELSRILADAEATYVISAMAFEAVLSELNVSSLQGIMVVDASNDKLQPKPTSYAWISLETLWGETPDANWRPIAMGNKGLATLVYTSGTTGQPKGVMLTHQNLWADVVGNIQVIEAVPADCFITISPLFHVFGQTNVMITALAVGARLVLVKKFSPRRVLQAIQQHQVTFMAAVPTMYQMMLSHLKEHPYDLRSIRVCHSGAAAMPVALIQKIEAVFQAPVQEGYGLSEASSLVCSNPLKEGRKPGTVGPPIGGVTLRVVDEFNLPLPPGEKGELQVQGPIVMQGYYRQPDLTQTVLTADGWLRTRDVASIDVDGYVSILDRLDDLMNVGGVKVYPREVEEVLHRHPAIQAAAVVGRPSTLYHQEINAFVVLEPQQTLTYDELYRHCAQFLADYKIPKQLTLVDEIPQGPTGKVLRRSLRS